jgi:hypothetical protein
MMSDFRGGGRSKMTPKNQIIEGKNWIKGGRVSKMTQKIGHHLCMIPNTN